MKDKVLRIIDANLNRSREGLRVCEEIARFALDSRALAQDLKTVRTRISTLARSLDTRLRGIAHSRDVGGDVGRSSRLSGSVTRRALRDVFAANIQRVEESLRVLEEFLKLVHPAAALTASRQRFKVYEIEKKALCRIDRMRHH